jgi:hypothetical protein
MKKLSGKHLHSMMLYLHKNIQESTDWTFEGLRTGKLKELISYPPNVELSDLEIKNLVRVLKDNPEAEDTLKKIMVNASMYPLFDLFNFIDGSGDIPNSNYESIELVECSFEEVEKLDDNRDDFLHDMFFSSYWDWFESKKV